MAGNSANTLVSVPRVRAEINGTKVDSVVHVDVIAAGSYKSSWFELTLSTTASSAGIQWLNQLTGRVTVKIFIRVLPDTLDTTLIEGMADSIIVDATAGLVQIQGRDYSSLLINSTYQDAFRNQTSSEIANYIASRHGFGTNISVTYTMVGSYQCGEYNNLLLNSHSHLTHEWALLVFLAKREGFELFINGTTLVFAPQSALHQSHSELAIENVIGARFHVRCPLSDQTTLTVKSWNSWMNQLSTYSETKSDDQSTSAINGLSSDLGFEIAVVMPNLTSHGAEQIAKQHINTLNEQALNVEVIAPGELYLKPLDIISISGSNSSFDVDYVVRSVRRHFSSNTGFIEYINGYTLEANPPSSPEPAA